jgi:hypothetical protein
MFRRKLNSHVSISVFFAGSDCVLDSRNIILFYYSYNDYTRNMIHLSSSGMPSGSWLPTFQDRQTLSPISKGQAV